MKVTFYFVRHGKTLFNSLGRMQGMCDSPLLPEGVEGAEDTASALRKVHFDACYSSSSERAMDTAEILCRPHGLSFTEMKELREFDFGNLDGEFLDDFIRNHNSGDEYVRDDWSEYGGDTTDIFRKRASAAFETMIENSHDGDNVLVVSHGAYIMHLMDTLLDYDREDYVRRCNASGRAWMPNCGICIFAYEDGRWTMIEEPMSASEYRMKYNASRVNFTFVRHGETLFNTQKRMQGGCDSPLTEKGILQAKHAKERLADHHFDSVFVSSSERTRDTASVILEGRGISFTTDKRLKEVHFGTAEAMQEFRKDPENEKRFTTVSFKELGGEDMSDVEKRLHAFFRDVTDAADDNDEILLVSHGLLYMCMLEILFGMDRIGYVEECTSRGIIPIPNCGISRFTYDHGTWTVKELMH